MDTSVYPRGTLLQTVYDYDYDYDYVYVCVFVYD